MSFVERLKNITVNVYSPDRSVKAHSVGQSGITIELRPGIRNRHSESSLAWQISAAITGNLAGYRKALSLLLDEGAEEEREPKPPTPRQRRLDKAVDAFTISSTSGRGHVWVGWSGSGSVEVYLRPGALDDLTEQQLEQAVNSTLAQALRQFSNQLARSVEATVRPTSAAGRT